MAKRDDWQTSPELDQLRICSVLGSTSSGFAKSWEWLVGFVP